MTARWQESIRSALIARDVRERAFEPFIRDYSRLAHHANQLRQRNLALVDAASGASRATTAANQDQNRASLGGGGQDELAVQTAVRTALITRLESELALARSELSDAYKLQSQHSQRLLTLSEQLHQSDERARVERDQLVEVKAEVERLREAARWHKEIVAEKEKQLVILQDELHSLELELSQLELQNDNLKTDNAALLQRWIHAKTEEARKMNEANAFLEEAKRIRRGSAGEEGGGGVGGGEKTGGVGEQTGERTGEEKSSPSKAKLDVKGKGKA
ncbi:hypothetical protein C6P46_000334 [Rhodotorula mucilaginosa]|uniref:Autophagy-related protein 16 domain-containing protein n=1 Tax=Rhodotorula mucilaginosa TaxID=5537 RepID=A0A9P6VVN7_RHOMI|nr:hypothetical protein C6P46_000334 [Rhodotorula mucilaginosa]TKA55815.1 hypothetical protein B0A53_02953 [Rhodotorula sp. CCFEE 5036]